MAYEFDHQWKQERDRLAALESVFDPYSQRGIRSVQPQPGWNCLEIGAGGGSMAEWMCGLVGDNGRVVATDLETKFLGAIDSPALEVRRHNVATDPLQREEFDLIHSRAVLAHLPERDAILVRLVDALKVGGWLVLVGADLTAVRAVGLPQSEARFFDSAFATMLDANRQLGFDPTYGRRLGAAFRSAGLAEVVMEGGIFEWTGKHPVAQLYSLTFQRLRPVVVGSGAMSEEDHERLVAMITDPDFVGLSHTVYVARGRKLAA